MSASAQVRKAIENGATPLAEGLATVDQLHFYHRPRDPGPYHIVRLYAGRRHVQVTVSPTGRTVHVHVDGVEVPR